MRKQNIAMSLVLASILVLTLGASFISAAECAGQDCSVGTTLVLGNSAPTITTVNSPSTITLTGGTTKVIYIDFIASDINGNEDLNFSSVNITLSKAGETSRVGASCTNPTNVSSTTATINCSITMQFYDGAGVWSVSAKINDLAGSLATNNTVTSTVNALNYVSQDITTISWPAVSANTADNEAAAPLVMTNGGNQDYTNISIKAFNATGAAHGDIIPAANFSIDSATGQTTGQVYMIENAYVQNAELTLAHGASVTESAYFYVDLNALQPDTYTQASTWSVKVSA